MVLDKIMGPFIFYDFSLLYRCEIWNDDRGIKSKDEGVRKRQRYRDRGRGRERDREMERARDGVIRKRERMKERKREKNI